MTVVVAGPAPRRRADHAPPISPAPPAASVTTVVVGEASGPTNAAQERRTRSVHALIATPETIAEQLARVSIGRWLMSSERCMNTGAVTHV